MDTNLPTMDRTGYKTVDEYIAAQDSDKQPALKKLRKLIRSVAPEAEELISYQIPMYKLNGMLVGFAAYAGHCSFTTANATTLAKFKDELKGYKYSVSTVQFSPQKPLPDALLKRIIKQRISENAVKAAIQKAIKKK